MDAIRIALNTARRRARAAGGPILSEDLDRDIGDAMAEAFGRPPPSDLDRAMELAVSRYSNRAVPPTNIKPPDFIDPVARPPVTLDRYEDIEMQAGGTPDDDHIPESELPIGPSGVPRITIPALGPTPKEGQQVQPVQPPSPTDVAKAAPRILAPEITKAVTEEPGPPTSILPEQGKIPRVDPDYGPAAIEAFGFLPGPEALAAKTIAAGMLPIAAKTAKTAAEAAPHFLDLDPAVFQQAYKSGKQLGSNPGGTFTNFPDGIDRYVKVPKNEQQARQEVLAGKFYELLGVPGAKTELTRTPNGKIAVASQIIPDAVELKNYVPGVVTPGHPWSYINHLREHFPADAWLANWDAIGADKENILVNPKTLDAYRIDQGGALGFRAKGSPKGEAFGDTVHELEEMKSPKYTSGQVFSGLKPDPDNRTAQRIAAVPDETIRQLVAQYVGPEEAYGKNSLADKLIARRDDLAEKYGLDKGEVPPQSAFHAELPKGEEAVGLSDDEWNGLLKSIQAPQSSTVGMPIMQLNKTHSAGQIIASIKDYDPIFLESMPKIVTSKQLGKIGVMLNNQPADHVAVALNNLDKNQKENIYSWLNQKQLDAVTEAEADLAKKKPAYKKNGYTDQDIANYYDDQHLQELKEAAIASGEQISDVKPGDFTSQKYHDAIEPIDWMKYRPNKFQSFTPLDIPKRELNEIINHGFNPWVKLFHGDKQVPGGHPEQFLPWSGVGAVKNYEGEKAVFLAHDPEIARVYAGWPPEGEKIASPYIARGSKVGRVDWPQLVSPGTKWTGAEYSGYKMAKLINAGHEAGYDMLIIDGLLDIGPQYEQTQYAVLNPAILRAPHAEFNPVHLHKARPLWGVAGGTLFTYGMMKGENEGKMARGGKVKKPPPPNLSAAHRALAKVFSHAS